MLFYCKMDPYILVNGLETKNMARVFKFGRMAQSTKDFGLMIRQMEEEGFFTQMETITRGSGSIINSMEKASMLISQ